MSSGTNQAIHGGGGCLRHGGKKDTGWLAMPVHSPGSRTIKISNICKTFKPVPSSLVPFYTHFNFILSFHPESNTKADLLSHMILIQNPQSSPEPILTPSYFVSSPIIWHLTCTLAMTPTHAFSFSPTPATSHNMGSYHNSYRTFRHAAHTWPSLR